MVHPQPTVPPSAHARGAGSRAGQVALTALGVVLIVLSTLVVTVVLLLSVGPVAFGVGLLAATLPVVPLVSVYLWLDRHEPEPRGLLLFAFGWGATVAVAGALLLSLPPTLVLAAAGADVDVAGAVVVAPVVEEVLKGLGILAILLLGRRRLDGLVDGFVYAGMVGVGFAFTENILYLGVALLDAGPGGLVATFLLRGVVSPFAHPLFTAATGIGIVLASHRRGASAVGVAAVGLGAAVLLHALWNGLALAGSLGFLGGFVLLWLPLFVTFVVVALVARSREGRMIRANVALYGRYGWFSADEERMLASLPTRRRALEWADDAGGPDARRAMRRFQGAAVDLAHLRQRMEAGTAPWDASAREQRLLGALTVARAALPGGSRT